MADISVIAEDSNVLSRVLDVKMGGRSFRTPVVASEHGPANGIGEIFIKVKDGESAEDLKKRLQKRTKRVENTALAFLVVDLTHGDVAGVADAVLDAVENAPNIAVCTPTFRKGSLERIQQAIGAFVNEATTREDVTLLPTFTPKLVDPVRQLQDFYKLGLLSNIVCIDYSGTNPFSNVEDHKRYIAIFRLIEREFGTTATYGISIHPIFYAAKYEEAPARDLASFFAHIDILGARRHVARTMPPEVILTRAQWSYKLDTEEYIYSRVRKSDEIELKNIEKKMEEAERIRSLLEKGEDMLKYIKSKRIAKIDEKTIKLLEKYARLYKTASLSTTS